MGSQEDGEQRIGSVLCRDRRGKDRFYATLTYSELAVLPLRVQIRYTLDGVTWDAYIFEKRRDSVYLRLCEESTDVHCYDYAVTAHRIKKGECVVAMNVKAARGWRAVEDEQ